MNSWPINCKRCEVVYGNYCRKKNQLWQQNLQRNLWGSIIYTNTIFTISFLIKRICSVRNLALQLLLCDFWIHLCGLACERAVLSVWEWWYQGIGLQLFVSLATITWSLQFCDSLIRPLPCVSEVSGTSIRKAQSAAVLCLSANWYFVLSQMMVLWGGSAVSVLIALAYWQTPLVSLMWKSVASL